MKKRIPIHSSIDLITNSSTEFYTNCESSLEPCKELVNEMLKLQGSDKTCDEIFELKLVTPEWPEEDVYDLEINVLDKEYEELASKLSRFLYSTESVEVYG